MGEQVLNQFRCDKKLREDCIEIYAAMGLDLNTAFRMFMERTRMVRGLPFPAVLPDNHRITSKEALENLRQMRASAADLPELTLDDINEEIRLTREQRVANRK